MTKARAYPRSCREPNPSANSSYRDDDQQHAEDPQTNYHGDKLPVPDLVVQDDVEERIRRNGKHKHATHRITDLQPDPLEKAKAVGRMDGVCG